MPDMLNPCGNSLLFFFSNEMDVIKHFALFPEWGKLNIDTNITVYLRMLLCLSCLVQDSSGLQSLMVFSLFFFGVLFRVGIMVFSLSLLWLFCKFCQMLVLGTLHVFLHMCEFKCSGVSKNSFLWGQNAEYLSLSYRTITRSFFWCMLVSKSFSWDDRPLI
ncbi:unnamed protein product [Coffea canephora]|uniref:Uncharacterized protein n=1 Tax=Coffea canephora TaxID=49390 RepID=A0A068UTI3_COFCA|nr:unnamed protein product [Coffea canephora]